MKDISKHYALLTPDERFRLFVEVIGRKDEQELDRLEATCPRRNYNAQDSEYTRKKWSFTVLALMTAVQKLRIELLASTALIVALATEANPNDTASAKAMEAFKTFIRLRQGKCDGWLQFCEGLGVNPDAMTAPFLENVEWAMRAVVAMSEILGQDVGDEPGNAEAMAARELEALICLGRNRLEDRSRRPRCRRAFG